VYLWHAPHHTVFSKNLWIHRIHVCRYVGMQVCVCVCVCVSHIQEWYMQCSASKSEQFQNKHYSANCVHMQSVRDEIMWIFKVGWFFNDILFSAKICGVWYKAEMFEVEAVFGIFDDNVLVLIWNARECPPTLCPHTNIMEAMEATNLIHKHRSALFSFTNLTHNITLLCQMEMLQYIDCHWGHEAMCPDTMGKDQSHCDVRY
jgi:hypothetical protein